MILNCPTGASDEILGLLDSIHLAPFKNDREEIKDSKILIDDLFLFDSVYSSIDGAHNISDFKSPTVPLEISRCFSNKADVDDSIIHEFARSWCTVSITVALFVSLLAEVPQNSYLSKHNTLRQLIEALVKLRSLGKIEKDDGWTKTIFNLPTQILLKLGNDVLEPSENTALERILDTGITFDDILHINNLGIERERFFEDPTYRNDSLFALISL